MSRNAFAQCEREYADKLEHQENVRRELKESRCACGTCDYCGVELPLSKLHITDGDLRCDDCQAKYLAAQDDDGVTDICADCNGSGEGMYDGTRCPTCRPSNPR